MPDWERPPNAKQLMLDLIEEINRVRADAKNSTYAPYTFNLMLTKAALDHCQWMAENASTSHTGLNDSTPGQRVTEARFIHTMVAENNLGGIQYQTSQQAVGAWRRSQDHNQNIFLGGVPKGYHGSQRPDEIEIGTACLLSVDRDIKIPYWCAVFAKGA
jgi:uncharacterized protein YkwD